MRVKILLILSALIILGAAAFFVFNSTTTPKDENTALIDDTIGTTNVNDIIDDTIIDDNEIIAFVNGVPISYGEYRHELAKNYTDVLSRAVTAGGIQGNDFWTTEIPGNDVTPGGVTPLEMLKATAMEYAVRRKIIQIWALENGFIEDISWDFFLDDFNKENLRRQTALDAGERVYGPMQFTRTVYYNLKLAEIEHDILRMLEATTVFDEDVLTRLFHDRYRENTYHPGKSTLDYTFIPVDAKNAYVNAQGLRQAVINGEDIERAAQRYNATYRRHSVNLLRITPGRGLPISFLESAFTFSTGDLSEVIEENGFYWFYQCYEREEGRYLDFESARQRIVFDLLRKEFEDQIEIRMKDALVIEHDVYSMIDTKMIMQSGLVQ